MLLEAKYATHLNSPRFTPNPRLFRNISLVFSLEIYDLAWASIFPSPWKLFVSSRRILAGVRHSKKPPLFVANRTLGISRRGRSNVLEFRGTVSMTSRGRGRGRRSWSPRRTESLLSRSSGRRWRAERHTWHATVISIRFASEPSAPSWDPRPSRRWIHPAGALASSNWGSGRSYEQTIAPRGEFPSTKSRTFSWK